MKAVFLVAAGFLATCAAQTAEELAEQLAALDAQRAALEAASNSRVRTASIVTEGGSIVLQAPEGKNVKVRVGDTTTNIDELVADSKAYVDAAAVALEANLSSTASDLAQAVDDLDQSTTGEIANQAKISADALAALDTDLNGKLTSGLKGVADDATAALKDGLEKADAKTDAEVKKLEEASDKLKKTVDDEVKVEIGKVVKQVEDLTTAPEKCEKATLGRVIVNEGNLEACTEPGQWNRVATTDGSDEPANAVGSKKNPARSCEEIIEKNYPRPASGKYFVCTDKASGKDQVECEEGLEVYCELDEAYDGGGWMLVNTLTHASNDMAGSKHPLTQNVNAGAPSLTSKYSRNWMDGPKRFNPATGDEFMIRNKDGQWARFVVENDGFCGWDSKDKWPCSGCHGTYAKGQIYLSDGSKVNCGGAGCWLNGCNSCGGCQSQQCDTIGFQADKTDYAYAGGGSQWRMFGSSWHGSNCGGTWGRKKDNALFPFNLFMRNNFGKKRSPTIGTSTHPAISCAHIKALRPNAQTGCAYYTVQSDRNAQTRISKVCCEMDTAFDGGGWMLINTKQHPANDVGGSRHPLDVEINAGSPSFTRKYSRYWTGWLEPKLGDEFMMRTKQGAWKRFVITEPFCGWNSRSSGICTGCHGTYAKGQIYHEDGTPVNCGTRGCWLNSCSVCGGCSSRGCDSIGFNADHADYAALYGGGNWRLYGSGWNGNCRFAWGRRTADEISPTNLFWRPNAWDIDGNHNYHNKLN